MNLNTDIKSAPHGRYVVKQRKEGVDQRIFVPERVILSTKCGKVVLSYYLPAESSSPRQERPSAQERSSDRSGGQFGDAPKPAHIPDAEVQP